MPSGAVPEDSQEGQVDSNRESSMPKRPLRNQECGQERGSWRDTISLLSGELELVRPNGGMSEKSLCL